MGDIYDEECDVIVLTDEDGKDHEFELIEILEVGDHEYAILAPMDGEAVDDEEAEEEEAIILRVETDEKGERVFSDIDDDEEWEKVAEVWESSLDEDLDDDEAESDEDEV